MNNPINDPMRQAKERYQSTEIPPELPVAVATAVRTGARQRTRHQVARRTLATALAACACFALVLNVNPSFASAVSTVPVLGQIARIFTVSAYSVHDSERQIDVRLPALSDTGHADLEQRINTEIQTRISQVTDEAELRASQAREAFVQTGGVIGDFTPVIINVDYQIKCQNEQYLSFIVTETETQATAYTQVYHYNLDLKTGQELSLRDLLGDDWKALCNTAVRSGIAARAENPENVYFDGTNGIPGFESIRDDQAFYLNTDGNPVLMFEKYEIAPGSMGMQEFEVAS